MENKKLFMISFLVNFIFSMITVLLSLIVFKINKSSTDISLVMIAFIGSLLITRGVLLKNFLSSRSEIVIGSGIFSIGCLLMFLGSTKLLFMFFGAVAFGLAIGMIPPAILSLLSSDNEVNKDMNLGIYNAIVALAAVFSPKIGEEMYDLNPQLLFEIWLILAICMFLLALLIKEQQNNSSEDTLVNLKKVVTNSKFQIYFLTLLFSSISYGAIVTYLPIYFTEVKLSIGIYYFFFWAGYIMVQFFKKISYNFKVVLVALLLILLGQLSLLLFSLAPVIYLFSLLYGMGYGALFKVFYVGIGRFESLAERNMGFSIIGLISYLGVGIAPVFLIPFSGAGWTQLFCGNLFYSCIGMTLFVFLWKKV